MESLLGLPPPYLYTKREVKINNDQTALLGRSIGMTSRKQFGDNRD